MGFPGSSAGKESACTAGDLVLFLGGEERRDRLPTPVFLGFPGGSDSKESTCNVGDLGLIPGLGRSPRRGHGNPLQHSCLEWGLEEWDMTERLSTQHTAFSL